MMCAIFFLLPAEPPGFTLFPTRRSSDLRDARLDGAHVVGERAACGTGRHVTEAVAFKPTPPLDQDRKSTRLNSSHQIISYAVFCLKKKNEQGEAEPCHGGLDRAAAARRA